ncbi:hypothetical protein [Bacillus sp. EB600]|uniref:hypothetical protein n=1 Tax=Bacillus sp. EB600 TaxID=2806345 RepID=UPI002108FD84|nr:hypothetical protein [Bacillus sp. EB600]MCQ6280336.1 hypothetical protein [Bacillus sp. EB600]
MQAVVPVKVQVIAQVKVQDVVGVGRAVRDNVRAEANLGVHVEAAVPEDPGVHVKAAVPEDPGVHVEAAVPEGLGLPVVVAGLAVIFDLEHKKDFGMMAICKNYD